MSNLNRDLTAEKGLYLELLQERNYDKLKQLVFTDSYFDKHRLYQAIFESIFSHNNAKLREFLTDSIIREAQHIDVTPDENNDLIS